MKAMKMIMVLATMTLATVSCGPKTETSNGDNAQQQKEDNTMAQKPTPGTDGNKYVPYEQRTGDEAVVYFTRDLSAEGLIKAYEQVNGKIEGKVGVKLHTGEQNGPNIIPREWVKALMEKDLPEGTIIETNTYYEGDRYTTEQHRKTLEVNGWTFCPVDIMDEEDTITLPVTTPGQPNQWDIAKEEFMERMTESTKASIDYFGEHVTYVNVMRNMSVSCDCEGTAAAPVVTPNVGILSSTDILAIDQACVDIIYAMTAEEHHDMLERIESRHGYRQLSYMKELGMGHDRYVLIDLDNGGKQITAAEAAKDLKPFVYSEKK